MAADTTLTIGQRIRIARKHAGLSHDSLGAMVGTSRQHLIKLEKGVHRPRPSMLTKIAEATGKDESFFANGQPAEPDDAEADQLVTDAMRLFGDLLNRLRALEARLDGVTA